MSGKDIAETIKLVIAAVPAMVLPQRSCRWLSWVMAWVNLRIRPWNFRARKRLIAKALSNGPADAPAITAQQVQLGLVTNNYEAEYFQPLRFYRPGHWAPKVRLNGRDYIDKAFAAGNGVILWVYPFSYYSIITKMALAQAGIPVVHLSRLGHGYNNSRFGIRYLNPIKTKVENRYLSERIELGPGTWTRGLRLLIQRIHENRLVTITADAHGRKLLSAPLFHGELKLATGAPNLALSTKAALLPTITVREPSGGFVVNVEPALHIPESSISLHDGEIAMVRQFTQVVEIYIRRHPEQWPDWHHRSRWSAPPDSDHNRHSG